MELQVVVVDGDYLRLPVGRQGAHPLQVRPRLPRRLTPVDEGRANPLKGGGARRILPFALLELIAQGHSLVRQSTVRSPQGVGDRVEGIAPLPELAKLGAHLIEGVIFVAGTVLELLPPTSRDL
jgi:hypothetical protein